MRKILIPAGVVILILALAIGLATFNSSPVSAQQIIDRAAAAYTAASQAAGIQHMQIETYQNLQALPGDLAGERMIVDSYHDNQTGWFRVVTSAAGAVSSWIARWSTRSCSGGVPLGISTVMSGCTPSGATE